MWVEQEREDNAEELARQMVHYVLYNQQAFTTKENIELSAESLDH